MDILVEQILPNPQQPRRVFDEDELRELANSLVYPGQILPVAVEEAEDGYYILQDGERRWRAAKLAGLKTLKAVVIPPGDGKNHLIRALVANVQRADLTPIEEARAYGQLREMGMSLDEIARSVGKCHQTIVNRVAWLDVEAEIQAMVEKQQLPADVRVCKALLGLDVENRLALARLLATRPGITIRAIVKAAGRVAAGASQPTDTPTVKLAHSRQPMKWNALKQAGAVPSWSVVVEGTEQTCKRCALAEAASDSVCKDCPVVDLLTRMMEAAK